MRERKMNFLFRMVKNIFSVNVLVKKVFHLLLQIKHIQMKKIFFKVFAIAAFISAGTIACKELATVTDVTVSPSMVNVVKGASHTFIATVTGTNDPAQTVTWSVVEAGKNAGTTIDADGKLSVADDERLVSLTVKAISTVDVTKSGTATVTIFNHPSSVSAVSVSPSTADVAKGESQTFTGTVTGTNNPPQTVTWTVVETGKNAGTTIDANGKLTVAAAEILASLTVKATSTVDITKSGTATVTIIDNSTLNHFNDLTAREIVGNIKIGWNLGNTLDCADLNWLGANPTVIQLETAWGNPVTTKANIDALKNAGFNAVRIPVSWAKCTDVNHNIRADWMARVKEVVNYAVANDMYILLNTHHDESIFKFRNADMAMSEQAFRKIWEQIAVAFKDYNEKLIFEALNEPRTKGSQNEWSGGTPEERANLNTHYRIFVETVRASGGNNDKRVLVINTYAASAEGIAMNDLEIPEDKTDNKIIASIHAYAPYNFALNTNSAFNTWDKNNPMDTSPITTPLDRAYNIFGSKGVPVIMGEFGAMNKNNNAARAAWAEFFTGYAKSRGIPCFWWDNGAVSDGEKFGLLDRKTNNFSFPEVVNGLMKGLNASIEPPLQPPPPNSTVITLGPNDPWGWQSFYDSDTWFGNKIAEGDVFTFTYTFKSNVAMDYCQFVLVDNSPAANYWTELSGYVRIQDNIAANTEYSGTLTITAAKSATGTASNANKIAFSAGTGTKSQPTLTFSTFSLVKN